jgi:hypothetical protein
MILKSKQKFPYRRWIFLLKKIGKTGTIKFLFNLKFWRLFKKPPCAKEFSLEQVLFYFLLYKTFFLNEMVNCNAPFPWDSFPWSIQYQPWLSTTLEKNLLVKFYFIILLLFIETVLKFFLECRIFVNDQNTTMNDTEIKRKNSVLHMDLFVEKGTATISFLFNLKFWRLFKKLFFQSEISIWMEQKRWKQMLT